MMIVFISFESPCSQLSNKLLYVNFGRFFVEISLFKECTGIGTLMTILTNFIEIEISLRKNVQN